MAKSTTVDISMVDLIGGLYYRTAENKARLGRDPNSQERAFAASTTDLPADLMPSLMHFGPMALHFAYADAVEAQRLLAQQGWTLVAASTEEKDTEQPVFLLAANANYRKAVIICRGSKSALDWLANVEFRSVPLFGSHLNGRECLAHLGMSRRAQWLQRRLRGALLPG